MADIQLERTLEVAAEVQRALQAEGFEPVVIGAVALAVHGYPRLTADIDLGVAGDPRALHRVAARLRNLGYEVEVRDPDPQDPLGGVMDVQAKGADLVQAVNFNNPPANGFPRLVHEALLTAEPLTPGSSLRVVDPYLLIASKLYAGGPKSKLDVLELLERNQDIDRSRLTAVCETLGLSGEWLALQDMARAPTPTGDR